MKEYFKQLWNDPAFFANTVRTVAVTVGTGAVAFMLSPEAMPLWKQIAIVAVGGLSGGTASLPSLKRSQ